MRMVLIGTVLIVGQITTNSYGQSTLNAPFNNGIATQGQKGDNYLFQSPQRLTFAPEIGDQIITHIPTGSAVTVLGVGNSSDLMVARAYEDYLRDHGYKVSWTDAEIVVPPPEKPIEIIPRSNFYVVQISPSTMP